LLRFLIAEKVTKKFFSYFSANRKVPKDLPPGLQKLLYRGKFYQLAALKQIKLFTALKSF